MWFTKDSTFHFLMLSTWIVRCLSEGKVLRVFSVIILWKIGSLQEEVNHKWQRLYHVQLIPLPRMNGNLLINNMSHLWTHRSFLGFLTVQRFFCKLSIWKVKDSPFDGKRIWCHSSCIGRHFYELWVPKSEEIPSLHSFLCINCHLWTTWQMISHKTRRWWTWQRLWNPSV